MSTSEKVVQKLSQNNCRNIISLVTYDASTIYWSLILMKDVGIWLSVVMLMRDHHVSLFLVEEIHHAFLLVEQVHHALIVELNDSPNNNCTCIVDPMRASSSHDKNIFYYVLNFHRN